MTESTDRKYPLRMPPDWEPPVPAFMAEFADGTRQVSMALVGCQFDEAQRESAHQAVMAFYRAMHASGVDYADVSQCDRDSTGHAQIVVTGYWFDEQQADAYFSSPEFKSNWAKFGAKDAGFGLFREVFNVPMGNYETLYSGPEHLVGVATVRTDVSKPVDRHAYWGSMRDRMPASATDAFQPSGNVTVLEQSDNRVLLKSNQNLAVIRSGQDLALTSGKERDEFFSDVEPSFRAGMDYLRDSGADVNCYDCRTMRFLNEDGSEQDHTYGLGFFRCLEDLEQWAEHHPTHRAIFDSFMEFAPRYGPDMTIRLWHEVSVLPAANQIAEYINCAEGTGLTAGI